MKTPISVLLLLLTFSTGALIAQQPLEGKWVVTGANPEGDSYVGTLEIDALNKVLHKMTWEVKYEDETQKQKFPGTGIFDPESNVMYAAYGIDTYRYGLIVYELNDKGGLEGSGSWTSHKGLGAELLAGKLNRSKIEGVYQVAGRRSKGDVEMGASELYDGTLIIKKKDDRYRLEWYLGDGAPYQGFAYKTKNGLVGAWGIGGAYGLEIYTFEEDKKQAESSWTTPNYDFKRGTEKISKM